MERVLCQLVLILCTCVYVNSQRYSFTIQTSDPNLLSQVQSMVSNLGSGPVQNIRRLPNAGQRIQNIRTFQNVAQPTQMIRTLENTGFSPGVQSIISLRRSGSSPAGSRFVQTIQPLENGGQRRFQQRIITQSNQRRPLIETLSSPMGNDAFRRFFLSNGDQPQTDTQVITSPNSRVFRKTMFWIQPQPNSNQGPPQSITPSDTRAEEMAGEFGIPTYYQKFILDFHNIKRSASNAADMYALKWNNQLAKESDDWAKQCKWGHQQAGRGENLAYVTGGGIKLLLDYGLNGWYDEIKQYDGKNCMDTGSCHYTQMVWSSSTEVGCAAHRCPDMHYLVCFYSPQGNIIGIPPFQQGTPCSACSGTCRENLCHWFNAFPNSNQLSNQFSNNVNNFNTFNGASNSRHNQLSASSMNLLLKFINMHRMSVDAQDMYVMKWSNSLAREAGTRSQTCQLLHRNSTSGESLIVVPQQSTGDKVAEYINKHWIAEKNDFRLGTDCRVTTPNTCAYSQMIWAQSKTMGCASHWCASSQFVVCLFDPPGNGIGMLPYIQGNHCQQCPRDTIRCENQLCDWRIMKRK
ncbi:hypothetical protein LOTGIDRAFT_233201 [Lottia gigantea]|uniref:SCP domain-containing protein n=1 Tax=Lottia gigantea TaxID=225164 RepID=V4AGC6_LOTGI|nr:hypothetical protein LOTGIDRAFT_233201 [Lottia gigantea]ESO92461.1 hypothetical protein LOTGIDRAFT_233201 [Lottia gigantea]